jgi:type 1 glutamine amidotransferase
MLRTTAVLAVLIGISTLAAGAPPPDPATRPRLLVVTVTKGFRHESIPTAESVLQKLADASGAFSLDFARTDEELKQKASAEGLKGYAGAVFASTTGDLPLASPAAFLDWIAGGRAFVGIHSASDTFHGFPAFLDMLGGEFDRHGAQARVQLGVEDPKHPAAREIAFPPSVLDEIYLFKRFDRSRVHIVLALDKHPNTGEAGFYPIAWTREQGRGRIFYTALGHREDVLESDWYGKHLLGGIRWALDATASAR